MPSNDDERRFDLGDGFSTDMESIENVFGDFMQEGEYNVEAILAHCALNGWLRWKSFWTKVKVGDIQL